MTSPLLREASLWGGWLSVLSLTTSQWLRRELLRKWTALSPFQQGSGNAVEEEVGKSQEPEFREDCLGDCTLGLREVRVQTPTQMRHFGNWWPPREGVLSLRWSIACDPVAAYVHEGLVWMWSYSEHIVSGVGETAWPLRVLPALRLDQNSVPGTQDGWLTASCNSSTRGSSTLCWPRRAAARTDTCADTDRCTCT